MKHAALAIFLLGIVPAGCAENATGGQQAPRAASQSLQEKIAGRGVMDMDVYDPPGPTSEGPLKPAFRVEAKGALRQSGLWKLEEATITIHERDGGDTVIRASGGEYNEAKNTAFLDGKVTLESGTIQMELMDVEWINDERQARSDKPVTIIDGETRLTGSGITYRPDEKRLVVREPEGRVAVTNRGGEP